MDKTSVGIVIAC